ncbi:3555_t:CDS:2 [Entrophospora sp. SA101]|nr:3555_t:CDS:2 [Entrophospora sp. SA101]CAJ0824863.1 15583_t:CDS:2 [Entrophospora sp. SA101]
MVSSVSSPSTYPLKGIYFFFSNWILVRRVIVILIITLLASLVTLGLVFGFLLKLQAHALIFANCPAWIAWIVSVIFCLLENALFDDVLRLRGLNHVLERKGRPSDLIITLLITMPLHLFPVIGTFLYCYLNGWIMTWGHQIHYHLEIKHWSVNQSRKFAWRNREDYIQFGAIAVALELIPILNLVFFWTNVVGAALWTADVSWENDADGFNGSHTLNDPTSTSSSSYKAAQRMNNDGYGVVTV